jgi:hypothetical protein
MIVIDDKIGYVIRSREEGNEETLIFDGEEIDRVSLPFSIHFLEEFGGKLGYYVIDVQYDSGLKLVFDGEESENCYSIDKEHTYKGKPVFECIQSVGGIKEYYLQVWGEEPRQTGYLSELDVLGDKLFYVVREEDGTRSVYYDHQLAIDNIFLAYSWTLVDGKLWFKTRRGDDKFIVKEK